MTVEDEENGFIDGFGRYRVITSFRKYLPGEDDFLPNVHHITYYAKDSKVRDLLLILSKCPSGRVVCDARCEIVDRQVFSAN